jgi:hypothetical protein
MFRPSPDNGQNSNTRVIGKVIAFCESPVAPGEKIVAYKVPQTVLRDCTIPEIMLDVTEFTEAVDDSRIYVTTAAKIYSKMWAWSREKNGHNTILVVARDPITHSQHVL